MAAGPTVLNTRLRRWFVNPLEVAVVATLTRHQWTKRATINKILAGVFGGECPPKGSIDAAVMRLKRRGWVEYRVFEVYIDPDKPKRMTHHGCYRLTPAGVEEAARAFQQQCKLWEGMPGWPTSASSTTAGS